MRIALILATVISVYASESCYTIQLISKYNSKNNLELLKNSAYPESCKIMEIGKSLTVRCECVDKFAEAQKILPKYKNKYKNAEVSRTYKYRFETKSEKENGDSLVVQEVKNLKTTNDTNQTVLMEGELVAEKIQVDEVNATALVVEEIKTPVEKKILEPKILVSSNENKSSNKKKKKKKNKPKYKKKRDANYPYTRYLDKLKSKEGFGKFDYRYSFGAQFSYDLAYINEADAYYVENDWRRVRVSHEGSFFDKSLFYSLEYSFTGANKYKDVYLGYENKIRALNTDYRIKYGNIKIPFTLERYSSSKNITFMERGLNDSYADGRKLGAELFLSTKLDDSRLNLSVSTFSNSIDERVEDKIDQPGYATRLTYGYKFDKRHLISVGAAYMNQNMRGKDLKLNQASESEFIQEKYVSVRIADVDTIIKNNVEALYIYDKYSIQAEYTTLTTQTQLEDYSFGGYYVQGSYFFLGKGKNYKLKESKLGKINPNKDGALEFAVRYSYIDLNDKDEVGGTQTDYTYGFNWYYSSELKFMFNYVVAEPKGTDDYDGRLQIVQARALFAF